MRLTFFSLSFFINKMTFGNYSSCSQQKSWGQKVLNFLIFCLTKNVMKIECLREIIVKLFCPSLSLLFIEYRVFMSTRASSWCRHHHSAFSTAGVLVGVRCQLDRSKNVFSWKYPHLVFVCRHRCPDQVWLHPSHHELPVVCLVSSSICVGAKLFPFWCGGEDVGRGRNAMKVKTFV